MLLCNTIGGGSGVLLDGCDEGTGPMTIGRQTEGGRAANGEAEDDVTEERTWVDDEEPHPETTPGVESVPSPELDTDDATELSNPSTVAVEPIRGGSAGSVFPVITILGAVVKSCPSAGACGDPRGKASGVDVSGGGSGPAPLFTLRLSGGSSGTALAFLLVFLLPPSLPVAGSADVDAD